MSLRLEALLIGSVLQYRVESENGIYLIGVFSVTEPFLSVTVDAELKVKKSVVFFRNYLIGD